jgi:hypothetical protein
MKYIPFLLCIALFSVAYPESTGIVTPATHLLVDSLKTGDYQGVLKALDQGADVNTRLGDDEETPLMMALRQQNSGLSVVVRWFWLLLLASFPALSMAERTKTIKLGFMGILAGTAVWSYRFVKAVNKVNKYAKVVNSLIHAQGIDFSLKNKKGATAQDIASDTFYYLDLFPLQTPTGLADKELSKILYGSFRSIKGASANTRINECEDTMLMYVLRGIPASIASFSVLKKFGSFLLVFIALEGRLEAFDLYGHHSWHAQLADCMIIAGLGGMLWPYEMQQKDIDNNPHVKTILALLDDPNLDLSLENREHKTALQIVDRLIQIHHSTKDTVACLQKLKTALEIKVEQRES